MGGPALQKASCELRADRDVVTAAVRAPQHCAYVRPVFESVHEALRADAGILKVACRKDYRALSYACAKLKSDRELLLGLFQSAPDLGDLYKAVDIIADELLADDEFLVDLLVARPCCARSSYMLSRTDVLIQA